MNWKVGLPAAALIVTLLPTGAFCRNHHGFDALNSSGGLSSGVSALSGGNSFIGNHGSSLTNGLTNGLINGASTTASPLANSLTNLLPGRFLNGRFNNNGSIFGNTGPGHGFRSMLGRGF